MKNKYSTIFLPFVLPSIANASDGTGFIYGIYIWFAYIFIVAAGLAITKLNKNDKFLVFNYFLLSNLACYFLVVFVAEHMRNKIAVIFSLILFIAIPWILLIYQFVKAKRKIKT